MTAMLNPTQVATPRFGALTVTGIAATTLASVATMTVAAAGHAVGIGLDMGGAPIPITGFAVLTAGFSLIGLVLAVALAAGPDTRGGRSSVRPWR